jgi:hypothetical protein
MLKRKWVMGAIVASALSAIPVVASAAIYVDIAPPEPRHEVVPAPRAGYVWAPGYYDYRNGRYRWINGPLGTRAPRQVLASGPLGREDGRYVFVTPGWRASASRTTATATRATTRSRRRAQQVRQGP